MNIYISARECEDIGHVHYLLAIGLSPGANRANKKERLRLLATARRWFDRAYVSGGSALSRNFAEECEFLSRKIEAEGTFERHLRAVV